jgi:hypothetical protein
MTIWNNFSPNWYRQFPALKQNPCGQIFKDDRQVWTAVTLLLITRDTDLLSQEMKNLTQKYDKYLEYGEDCVEK